MFKYAIALLIPFVSFAASVITKPYDQLDKNDVVVTNVNFSGLTTPSDVTNIAQYVASSGALTTDLVARASADSAYLLATNTYNITTQKLDRVNGTSTNQTLRLATVGDHLSFALTTQPVLNAGEIAWDPDWLTFKAGLSNGVEGQFFQEHHIVVKNAWTNTIPNGWVVMHSGTVGNSGKYEVVPAISTPTLDPTRVLGMTTESIPVGGIGRITARGNVNEIGSDGSLYGASGWQNNTPVYLCTTHVGWVTTNMIQAPYPRVYVGNIVRALANGAIYVRVQPGLRLSDLDDVNGTPLTTTGQIPVYDSVREVFDFNRNVNEFAGTNAVSVHTNRTDNPHSVTLAQAAAAGGFAGTEEIQVNRVNTKMLGELAGDGASGNFWSAVGNNAGRTSLGNAWSAYGYLAGSYSRGNAWAALGYVSGQYATGNLWSAMGLYTGMFAAYSNSASVGEYSGYNARGNNRFYFDVYGSPPEYAEGGSTNDVIFGDNGYLTLGRGAGAPGGSKGGTLRGVWCVDSLTNATLTGSANLSGDTLIGAQGVTNVVNGIVPSGIVTNGMGGMLLSTNAAGARYVRMTGDGGGWGSALEIDGNLWLSNWGASTIRFPGGGYVTEGVFYSAGGEVGFKTWLNDATRWVIRSLDGHAYIDNGNLTVAGTNTAAVLSSQGPVLLGPTIDGKQAHLFSNGMNFYTVSVNGDTNSFSPPTIVQPILQSATNVVIAATNAVYYVALTNAANIGFDFSGLALGGVSNAQATVFIDCLNTQALYSVINTNAVSMDCAWEPTVTGRYELAVSSDGVRTKVVQNSPSMCFFTPALIAVDLYPTSYGAMLTTLMPSGTLSREIHIANENNPRELAFLRLAMSFGFPEVNGHLSFVCGSAVIGEFAEWSSVTNSVYAYPSGVNGHRPAYIPMRPAAAVSGFALPTRLVRVIKDIDDSRGTAITSATIRRMNALERAAFNAGSYPAAFRLDY